MPKNLEEQLWAVLLYPGTHSSHEAVVTSSLQVLGTDVLYPDTCNGLEDSCIIFNILPSYNSRRV